MSVFLQIADKITWQGWQEEPWEQVKEASLLLVPSNSTSGERIAIEALARGIPVLAMESKGMDEIVQYGHNGWMIVGEDERAYCIRQ